MTITARIQEKLENYRTHVLMAIDYFSQEKFDEAAVRFRMSAEAYMKVLIYEHLGDAFGHEVILAQKFQDGSERQRRHSLFYYELLALCNDPNNNWIDARTNTILEGIKDKSNAGAHDSNAVLTPAELGVQLNDCYELSEDLTNELYTHMGRHVPNELINAYSDTVVDAATISALQMTDMDYFVEQVDNFDKGNRYILVAPFSTQGISETLLRNLMGVRWSVVIDFNCHTKEPGGIYHSMQPTIDENCTPFTILNRDGLSNMSKGTNGNVNWIYANGLSTLQGTVTPDIKTWIGKRMHHFLRDALTEFCKKSLSRIHIISLLDEPDYLAEIIHQFDGIDFAERDLITFSIISDDAIVRDDSLKLSRYGFDIKSYNFPLQSFLSQIGDFMQPEERHTILIPARGPQNESLMLDVTNIYSKFSANGISVIHHDIASEGDREIKPIPAFYQGETITWKELEADIDVQRSRYEELRRKILDRLKGRQSQKFQLYHLAGAGGTTVSRRLAYDLRDEIPTIIINEYVKGTTFGLIELLSMKVNRPMLAIVESSKVGNIDDLIAECNAKKRMVVFVYVERTLKRPQMVSQPFLDFISDKMHDAEEKSKFSYKVQLYNPSHSNEEWIKKTSFANCEVLDFSMSIAEKDYNRAALSSYIQHYLRQISEPVAEFLAYVSLIYYYAQRSVSDLVFRKVLETNNGKSGLMEYLRSNPQEKPYLDKLITDDSDGLSDDREWRPRYSVFAELMLEQLLGGTYPERWKDALPEWSRKLIKAVKNNYEFLTDEVQKMLVAVFLEREKEDLLGQEEAWGARGAQEKFSQLLDDMAFNPDDQKNILKLLAESFPTVSHFWGHLARYCYENADTPDQFVEAAEYIEKALDQNGQNDYNLLHIAGMCRRRQIEYYHRTHQTTERDNLMRLTAAAREYFRQSRDANPKNVHAYTSEIQLLTIVIEYGKSLSSYDKYYSFLVARENAWFFELYEDLNDLIDELSSLVDQMSTLGFTNRINRTKTMLARSESKSWEYVGDFKQSLNTLQEHIRKADRLTLPRLRTMYVRTLLLSKVNGKYDELLDAWTQLSASERSLVSEYLNKNVQQNSGDVMSMKLWIQLVRYSGLEISIEEVKSRLNMMYKSSEDFPMTRLEAAYNLYMLNLFELIRDNDTLNNRKKDEILRWIDICKDLSPNDKYPYEWLYHLDDISGIVSAKSKPDFKMLERVTGTITDIKSNAQGTIRLDCGFDVFFTPSVGYFIQGKDETTRVEMAIGFRHEGPTAYEVTRLNDEDSAPRDIVAEETTQDLEITTVEAIEPKEDLKEEPKKEEWKQPGVEMPKLKVVGKIDLNQFKKYERPRKLKGKE